MFRECNIEYNTNETGFQFSQWNVFVSPETDLLTTRFRELYRRAGKDAVLVPFFWCREVREICQGSDNPLVSGLLGHGDTIEEILKNKTLLSPSSVLFLEFPETRRTPEEMKPLILSLCAEGVQVFLATHSLFLLRELDMYQEFSGLCVRWFSFTGDRVRSGFRSDDIDLHMLDSNLDQSTRYLRMEQDL